MLVWLSSTSGAAGGSDFSAGLLTGYNNGLGFQLFGSVSNFAQDFPFMARFGLGYTAVEPGDGPRARKIFINDATNGVPQKKGWVWDYRLDLLYRIFRHTSLSAGVRYSQFTGNFVFVGGNEDFDVRSDTWGLGVGLESRFRMSSKIDLVIGPGVDYYFPNSISGHDTAYGPGGENVNPRKGYGYADADSAIGQPKWVFRFMAGVSYSFGR
jgi:hypothetical protein